ncbi:hypothetical protein ATANTOWER_024883 [Ataeniobius toweri]|uniref:Uncharacterized protein n=1 Tax=Ataeniobius toweri TaxID=208326 RepID=A0ABU7BJG9_9TELE|nr:hypothetical protein [Ataeniobius toweri]
MKPIAQNPLEESVKVRAAKTQRRLDIIRVDNPAESNRLKNIETSCQKNRQSFIALYLLDIDRKQVLQNIKVRKALKKDASWIQEPKDAKVDSEVKQKPAPGRRSLYVLSTAKRYE